MEAMQVVKIHKQKEMLKKTMQAAIVLENQGKKVGKMLQDTLNILSLTENEYES